jgi:hypothetical protein
MGSLIVDGSVTWELINVANSGSGSTAESQSFSADDFTKNGDVYTLAVMAERLPLAVVDSNNNSVLYDTSGNNIVLEEPISGKYYYKLKV